MSASAWPWSAEGAGDGLAWRRRFPFPPVLVPSMRGRHVDRPTASIRARREQRSATVREGGGGPPPPPSWPPRCAGAMSPAPPLQFVPVGSNEARLFGMDARTRACRLAANAGFECRRLAEPQRGLLIATP